METANSETRLVGIRRPDVFRDIVVEFELSGLGHAEESFLVELYVRAHVQNSREAVEIARDELLLQLKGLVNSLEKIDLDFWSQ